MKSPPTTDRIVCEHSAQSWSRDASGQMHCDDCGTQIVHAADDVWYRAPPTALDEHLEETRNEHAPAVDLDAIDAIAAKATAGPYRVNRYDCEDGSINWQVQVDAPPGEVISNIVDSECKRARWTAQYVTAVHPAVWLATSARLRAAETRLGKMMAVFTPYNFVTALQCCLDLGSDADLDTIVREVARAKQGHLDETARADAAELDAKQLRDAAGGALYDTASNYNEVVKRMVRERDEARATANELLDDVRRLREYIWELRNVGQMALDHDPGDDTDDGCRSALAKVIEDGTSLELEPPALAGKEPNK